VETEQDRFMRLAYARTVAAARKAFRSWHICKREDAVQEAVVKMLDQWLRLVQRGGDPEPIIGGMIYHALMFVRYDRKVAGRARRPDVFDYRSGLKQQRLNGQGYASPSDRSDPENGWIDWRLASGDDPAEVVAALEVTGLTLADLNAA
jgi:hypothetical protein